MTNFRFIILLSIFSVFSHHVVANKDVLYGDLIVKFATADKHTQPSVVDQELISNQLSYRYFNLADKIVLVRVYDDFELVNYRGKNYCVANAADLLYPLPMNIANRLIYPLDKSIIIPDVNVHQNCVELFDKDEYYLRSGSSVQNSMSLVLMIEEIGQIQGCAINTRDKPIEFSFSELHGDFFHFTISGQTNSDIIQKMNGKMFLDGKTEIEFCIE